MRGSGRTSASGGEYSRAGGADADGAAQGLGAGACRAGVGEAGVSESGWGCAGPGAAGSWRRGGAGAGGRGEGGVWGVGSVGTFTGIARFLKGKDGGIVMVAVEPQGSVLQGGAPGTHRVEGIGVTTVPATFDRSVCDRVMMVVDDPAFAMVRRL